MDRHTLAPSNAALVRRTVAAIRAIDPDRPIVIDGLNGGNEAMPELADLGVTHSGRGYQPMPISHHQAAWWPDLRLAIRFGNFRIRIPQESEKPRIT
jgi:hypothetical protein